MSGWVLGMGTDDQRPLNLVMGQSTVSNDPRADGDDLTEDCSDLVQGPSGSPTKSLLDVDGSHAPTSVSVPAQGRNPTPSPSESGSAQEPWAPRSQTSSPISVGNEFAPVDGGMPLATTEVPGSRTFLCDICGSVWSSYKNLLTHKRTHGAYYVCLLCPGDSSDGHLQLFLKKHLYEHFRQAHESIRKKDIMEHAEIRYLMAGVIDYSPDPGQASASSVPDSTETDSGPATSSGMVPPRTSQQLPSTSQQGPTGTRETRSESCSNQAGPYWEMLEQAVERKLSVLKGEIRNLQLEVARIRQSSEGVSSDLVLPNYEMVTPEALENAFNHLIMKEAAFQKLSKDWDNLVAAEIADFRATGVVGKQQQEILQVELGLQEAKLEHGLSLSYFQGLFQAIPQMNGDSVRLENDKRVWNHEVDKLTSKLEKFEEQGQGPTKKMRRESA